MTERLHFHFSLSCIGEGSGNPLQCSCLENPRDGEPGGLLSMGWHRVGHEWSDLAAAAAAAAVFIITYQTHSLVYTQEKWNDDHTKTCPWIFTAILLIIAKNGNNPNVNW